MTDDNPHTPKRTYLQGEPNAAADLIRKKIETLYHTEPDAVDEAVESFQSPSDRRSKHQQFMYDLTTSGKPLAEIQTAWHIYYQGLSDDEKHDVWQEFYAANQHHMSAFPAQQGTVLSPAPSAILASPMNTETERLSAGHVRSKLPRPLRSVADIKKQILGTVRTHSKLSRKQHLQSIGFGLGMGAVVLLILLFGFFNERFLAPFITPNRSVSSTPLILSEGSKVGPESKVIIPKINVEVPVIYDVATVEEASIQNALERGTVHYATTSNPGEQGNTAIFGHSSNNILNKGQYKFAFVLLSRLEVGDTFYLQKGGIRYVYKIFDKKIVKPTDFSVLEPTVGKAAVATLITCDPPGTSINRLVVTGEQISPDPGSNITSTALKTDQQPKILAGNAESLWHRMTHWIF